jgi:pimeloyl-ACP methyl ester carboxylesterase
LVGVSFGGWLACNLAIRASPRLASCSLLDPAATLARFPASLLLRTTLALLPVISRWTRPAFLNWISGGTETPQDDPVAEVINAGIRDFRISLPVPRPFTDEQVRSIHVPVLAIIAGRSVIHDPRAAYTRSALIPTVQAELWPTATHAISGQCATEVNERVIRFIASTAIAGRPARG